MKRFSYFVLFVAMLATACAGTAPEPTATALPPPTATNTPVPTDTPLPTDTPTPEPTATPDAAATAAAQSTQAAEPVLTELRSILGDSSGVSYAEGYLLWQQTNPVIIELSGPSGRRNTYKPISEESITAKDFIFKADVTWNATGWMFCGAAFRSDANIEKGKQYELSFLRFSGLPAYFIDVYDGGLYKSSLSDARFSEDIDITNSATNQYAVVAQADKFTVYFNGRKQSDFFDSGKQRMDGLFGFLAWQESGKGSCEFKNGWIWSLDK